MRHDSAMNPGRLHVVPKRPYEYGDDHTSTMILKKQAMDAGIDLGPPRYVPQHVRSARGIKNAVIGGTLIWAFVLLTGYAVYRAVHTYF